MPVAEFSEFLSRSLELIEEEAPTSHRALGRALAGHAVRISVDAPAAVLRFGTAGFAWLEGDAPAEVELRVDRQTLLDLIDARVSLEDSILEDRFHLRGPIDSIVWFDDGLLIYLDGAIRCPSFPTLLAEFRAGTIPPIDHLSREVIA